jgi:hypothetical protein
VTTSSASQGMWGNAEQNIMKTQPTVLLNVYVGGEFMNISKVFLESSNFDHIFSTSIFKL